mmetsp:Transcript_7349/g.17925  ORF Transcript_7349/g.17925 Transcript_7349/m.17925 type:complete len:111 (-) Transcript_7349:348-680(-)
MCTMRAHDRFFCPFFFHHLIQFDESTPVSDDIFHSMTLSIIYDYTEQQQQTTLTQRTSPESYLLQHTHSITTKRKPNLAIHLMQTSHVLFIFYTFTSSNRIETPGVIRKP